MYYCIVFDNNEKPLHAYSFELLPTGYTASLSYEAFKSCTRKNSKFRYSFYDKIDFEHWHNFHVKAGCEKLNITYLGTIWDIYSTIGYNYKLKKFVEN